MIKILFKSFLLFYSVFSTISFAYAVAAAGGFATEPTAMAIFIKDAYSAISNAATQVNTSLTAISTGSISTKITVLDPIANQIINVARSQAANQIITWANGGFNGADPLIIGDPGKYFDSIKTNVYKDAIGQLANANLPESNSLINSLISTVRNDQAPLTDILKSDVPTNRQASVCNDDALTRQALNDASAGLEEGAAPTNDAVQARKKELYNSFCAKDASTDSATASRLAKAEEQGAISDLDTFYKETQPSGNQYTLRMRGLAKVSDKAEKAQAIAKDTQSNGVDAEKECIEWVKYDDDGNALGADAPCINYKILTPAPLVKDQVSKASTISLDRSANAQGLGSIDFGSVLSDLPSILKGFSSITSIAKALNGSGGSTGSVSTGSVGTGSSGGGATVSTISSATKDSITGPMYAQLSQHRDALTKLVVTDGLYLADIAVYETKIQSVKSCYNALNTDFPTLAGNSSITAGLTYAASRQTAINTQRIVLASERASSTAGITFIDSVKMAEDQATTWDQIQQAFQDYQNKVNAGILPSLLAYSARDSDYQTNAQNISLDQTNINSQLSTCASLRQTEQDRLNQINNPGN